MPMRRISTSLPRVGFADDASPLSEGLAYAAGTLGELWPRLSQIEAEKQAAEAGRVERSNERDAARTERETNRTESRQLWEAGQGSYQGDDAALKSVSQRNADDFARKAKPPRSWDSAWNQSIQEIGSPDFDMVMTEQMTVNGPVKVPVKQPTTPAIRQQRVEALNRRARELTGEISAQDAPELEPAPSTSGDLWQGRLPPEPIAPQAPTSAAPQLWNKSPMGPNGEAMPQAAPAAVSINTEQGREEFRKGAGGWSNMYPTWMTNQAPATTPTPTQDTNTVNGGPDVKPWLEILSQPGTPQYAESIKKLKRWRQGIDENGQPDPRLKQWADSITQAMGSAQPPATLAPQQKQMLPPGGL